jgi:hypothetical protein
VNFQRKNLNGAIEIIMSAGKLNHEKSPDTVPIMSCKNFSSLLSFVPRKKYIYFKDEETLGLFLILYVLSYLLFSIYLHLSFYLSYLLPAVSLPLLLPRLPHPHRETLSTVAG